MRKKSSIVFINRGTIFIILCLFSIRGYCQSGEATVDVLVGMGFENVSWTEDEKERVYVFENTPYRLSGVGVGKAIDRIQEIGMPANKTCRVIVLENNVPLISLNYQPILGDTVTVATRYDWNVSYNLGDSWKKVRKQKSKNSSLFKVDVVIYPELSLQNYILNQIYTALFNISPAVEVSLWKGMKFTGQIIIPVYNDYGRSSSEIRQGFISLTQAVRLPYNIFANVNIGTFNNSRWGADLRVKHVLMKDQRFSFEGRVGYTGVSTFEDFVWHVSPLKRLTWTLGANFYYPKYNTQASLKLEQYLLGEKGVRFDIMRNFRHTSIGFYFMKAENAPRNGGFYFQIALPPYGKYKRKHVRVTPAKYFGMSYNAGNERYYGKSYTPQLGSTLAYEMNYNPYFIKSELLNF